MKIRPLQYGDVIEHYENTDGRTPDQLAAVFRLAYPALEDVTAQDVQNMRPRIPDVLETAALVASGLTGRDDESEDDADEFEDSIFAAHNKAERKTEQYEESDVVHMLHERGYTYDEIYRLLIPEIDLLVEGAERHEDRSESAQSSGASAGSSGGVVHGNRGDRASELFGRRT